MQITLNYAYTQDQLKRAYRFNVFPTPRAKYFMLFFSVIIFGIGILTWFIWQPNTINALLVNALKNIILALCLIWISVLLAVAINYYYLPVYAFQKSQFYKGDFTVNLLTEGLAYKQKIVDKEGRSDRDGFVYWGAFTKKAENDEFIILYIGRKHSIIPKASFPKIADLQEFKLFLLEQKHIKTKKFNGTEIWDTN